MSRYDTPTPQQVRFTVNKIDIWRIRYHFASVRVTFVGSYDPLHNRLWRHHTKENRVSETQIRCVMCPFDRDLYTDCAMQEIEWNVVGTVVMNISWANWCDISYASRELINKMIPSWRHKQFKTPVDALFSLYTMEINAFITHYETVSKCASVCALKRTNTWHKTSFNTWLYSGLKIYRLFPLPHWHS